MIDAQKEAGGARGGIVPRELEGIFPKLMEAASNKEVLYTACTDLKRNLTMANGVELSDC